MIRYPDLMKFLRWRRRPMAWSENPTFKIDDGPTYDIVLMKQECYAILGPVHGLPVMYRYPEFTVTIAYQCQECKKHFLAADEEGLKHECTEEIDF